MKRSTLTSLCVVMSTYLASPLVGHAQTSERQPATQFGNQHGHQTETEGNSVETFPDKNGQIVVALHDKPTGSTRTVLLEGSDFRDFEKIVRVPYGKIIVQAKPGEAVRSITIIDTTSGKILDNFLCWEPAFSPDARYIAFIKFYAEHGGNPEDDSNFFMLYDLSKDTAANTGNFGGHTEFDKGILIYPSSPGLPPVPEFFDRGDRPDVITHQFTSELFWSPDSTHVLFLDQQFPGRYLTEAERAHDNLNLTDKIPEEVSYSFILATVTDGHVTLRRYRTDLCADSVDTCPYIYTVAATYGADGIDAATILNPGSLKTDILHLPYAAFSERIH